MCCLLEWIKTRLEIRELQILAGVKNAGPWGRIWQSMILVFPYWVAAAFILVVAVCIRLLTGSSIPLTVGGILVAFEGLILGFYISPDKSTLATIESFSNRLKKMRIGNFSDRAEIENGFRGREIHRNRWMRLIVSITNIAIFLIGVAIALAGEVL